MKQVSIVALGLALALGGVAASPAMAKDKPAKEAPYKPSDGVAKASGPIQDALTKKDYATAKPLVEALIPVVQNDDDKYFVGHWLIQIGQGTNDMAELSKGVDLTLSSARTAGDDVKSLSMAQGKFAYQAKDYAKATAAFQRASEAGNTDPDLVPLWVESLRISKQPGAAMKVLMDGIAKMQAANQPVPAEWYGRGFAIAYEVKPNDPSFAQMRAQALALCKAWVAAQPKGEVWHDSLLLVRDSMPAGDSDMKLDGFRLQMDANALHGAPEYLEYVEAVYQRYPGEAKAVLDAGVAKGAIVLASNRNASEINTIVTGKIAADKASLAAGDKSARASGNVKALVSTADAYLGYGEYAKAIDLYNVALSKGADANLINTRIGEAQFRSGDKAAAKASFAKVTGPRKDLADFYAILADHPVAG